MLNYIDKLRIAATFLVFFLHSLLFTGKNFPMMDILKDSGGYFIFFTPAWGGVWIFFVLSGFLAGVSWLSGRYNLTRDGVIKYYKRKIYRIYIPTVFFIGFAVLVANPSFLEDWHIVFSILTSTYNGRPGFFGMGATWYVFSLMWLYFMVPVLCLIYSKYSRYVVFGVSLVFGLLMRIFWFYSGDDWCIMYTFPICNIDLFACGFGVAYWHDDIKVQVKKCYRFSLLFFMGGLIVSNAYIIAFNWHLEFYQYFFPTLYLILSCLYLWLFRIDAGRLHLADIVKKYLKKFSNISFEFYLFHSLIFGLICSHVGGHSAIGQWTKYVLIGMLITLLCAKGWNKIFQSK